MPVPKATKYMIELIPECQELLAVMREADVMKAALCKLQSRVEELLACVPKDRAQRIEQLGYAKPLTEPHKQLRIGSRVCRLSSQMMEVCTVLDMRLTGVNGGYSCSLSLRGHSNTVTVCVMWLFDTGLQLYGTDGVGILVLCDE